MVLSCCLCPMEVYYGMRQRRAFTLIELLVVVAISGVLASLLIPAVGMVRKSARMTQCANSLKQLGMGIEGYAQDWNGAVVPSSATDGNWMYKIDDYVSSKAHVTSRATMRSGGVLWGCTEWKGRDYSLGNFAYWTNGYGINDMLGKPTDSTLTSNINPAIGWGTSTTFYFDTMDYVSSRLLVSDSNDWHVRGANVTECASAIEPGWVRVGDRHGDRVNVTFCDLHTKAVSRTDAGVAINNPPDFDG